MLELTVFICGAVTMILELLGSRIFAPYVGTSIYVWTSLIGVILGSLSLGYWWGGRLSDKEPSPRIFARVLLMAALSIALIAVFSDLLLALLQSVIVDIRAASVLSAVTLFGVPSLLLGMVSPYAVRLKTKTVETTGSTVGSLYALSTLGSIAGTFLTGFFLIAYFNTAKILMGLSVLLVVLSVMVFRGHKSWARGMLAVALLVSVSEADSLGAAVRGPDLIDMNTRYNRVWIYSSFNRQALRPMRVLQVNEEGDSAMFTPDEGLVFEYTKYYRLAAHFAPGFRRTLMIGGAAYSFPKHFLKEFPAPARMDVVEIDPGVTALAKKYFFLKDDPRLSIVHEDARTYLNGVKASSYDVIFADAFKSYSVPFQLTTVEAVRKIYEALGPGGVVIMNLISAAEGPKGLFLRSELATYRKFFPQVYCFGVQDADDPFKAQNFILVALKSEKVPKFYSLDEEMNRLLQHIWIRPVSDDVPPLEDDFAPVDRYMAAALKAMDRQSGNPAVYRVREFFRRITDRL